MLKIIAVSILLLGIAFPSFAACGSPDKMDSYILLQFKEEKTWTGLSDIGNGEQQLTFLYENPETGSWTLAFYSLKNHKTCIIMAGQSSTHISAKLKGSKS
jgi:hypothetical protein